MHMAYQTAPPELLEEMATRDLVDGIRHDTNECAAASHLLDDPRKSLEHQGNLPGVRCQL